MAKNLFKRYIPSPQSLRENRSLRFLGPLLDDPYLLHLNRRSVTKAMFVGFACAFIPLPIQMVFAAVFAIIVRCNLPLAVSLVWVTNPITIPPMFYMAYKIGTFFLAVEPSVAVDDVSAEWLGAQLTVIWQPLLLGCLICSLASGSIAALITRVLWNISVRRKWAKRQQRDIQAHS